MCHRKRSQKNESDSATARSTTPTPTPPKPEQSSGALASDARPRHQQPTPRKQQAAIAIAASIVLAAILAISTHVTRRRRVATIALSPKLVQLLDLESEMQVVARRAHAPHRGRTASGAGH